MMLFFYYYFQTSYECSCCHGYSGQYCEDLDACLDNPCLNHGTCIDHPKDLTGTKYHCECALGMWCIYTLCRVHVCFKSKRVVVLYHILWWKTNGGLEAFNE